MTKITDVHKGYVFSILKIVIIVIVIFAIVILIYMSRAGYLEQIALQIQDLLSIKLP